MINMCKMFDADTYVNLPGGVDLYSKNDFKLNGIELLFISLAKPDNSSSCFANHHLSILDSLMNLSPDKCREALSDYSLIQL